MPNPRASASQQSEIISFLSDQASYGLVEPVERFDTHAAIVFLAGDRAYKLKRAVTLPYLDYGTPALRRAACEAELKLNRRTAPTLYLEVRAVRRTSDGHLSLGSAGDAVDWLVVMRRFDEDCLFDHMAARGKLTQPLLQKLADTIAAFHAAAEIVPGHGGAAAMRKVIDANRESMAGVEDIIAADAADRLRLASLDALTQVAPLLDKRRDSGRVRRCHGDLHLRNICLLDGEPTLFDCIEFSEDIACIDILYDLAFLVMDLWQRGLTAEANFVFNRYFDVTDDADGLAALPLFLSARAAVRAHVEAVAAGSQQTEYDRNRRQVLAQEYLALAEELLKSHKPRLVAIGGLSGTGKTTLARMLAPALGRPPGARVLRSDVVRKRLQQVPPERRLPESAYTRAASAVVYDSLYSQVDEALASGLAAVADAVFADPAERAAIQSVGESRSAEFTGLWLEASKEELQSRLSGRTGDASDATAEVMMRQLRHETGPIEWHRIDAAGNVRTTLEAASAIVRA
jgi:hypothetical protein